MAGGPLSPLMLTAGAGLVQNQGLGPSARLTTAIASYQNLPIAAQFASVVSAAAAVLDAAVLDDLLAIGASSFPALSNAIPTDDVTALAPVAPNGVFETGLTGLAQAVAVGLTGAGDNGKLSQIYNQAVGYASQANQFINSNNNVQTISVTFGPVNGGMDNLITGSVSQVSEALGALGSDLLALGDLIDLAELEELGLPSTLLRQLAVSGGLTGAVQTALRQAGLTNQTIISFSQENFQGISDSANRSLYQALAQITGEDLAQIKSILSVTTPNIFNAAELLDPAKILPQSYQTLTTPTPDGLRAIYDPSGAVNFNIEPYFL